MMRRVDVRGGRLVKVAVFNLEIRHVKQVASNRLLHKEEGPHGSLALARARQLPDLVGAPVGLSPTASSD